MVARVLSLAPFVTALLLVRDARAEEGPGRPPLPESLLTESATDVDATEAGELEIEANVASMRAHRGGSQATLYSIEAEWRVLTQVGVRLEPSYARMAAPTSDSFGLAGALALGLFHDFAHDFHVQAELTAHTTDGPEQLGLDPSETVQPVAMDLVSAKRVGRFTFRSALGVEAGGAFEHAPLHADVAAMTGILPDARLGFVALEVRTDWARKNPLVLAPEVVSDWTALGLPFRLGVAIPLNVGADDTRQSYGIFMRLILLTDREADFDDRRSASALAH